MILNIRVIPKASHVRIIQTSYQKNSNVASRNLVREEKGFLKVYLTKPACDGLANRQLIERLAEYLKIKKYQIKIIQGEKSRDKRVEINV